MTAALGTGYLVPERALHRFHGPIVIIITAATTTTTTTTTCNNCIIIGVTTPCL